VRVRERERDRDRDKEMQKTLGDREKKFIVSRKYPIVGKLVLKY
jgi:hypothetical protein